REFPKKVVRHGRLAPWNQRLWPLLPLVPAGRTRAADIVDGSLVAGIVRHAGPCSRCSGVAANAGGQSAGRSSCNGRLARGGFAVANEAGVRTAAADRTVSV